MTTITTPSHPGPGQITIIVLIRKGIEYRKFIWGAAGFCCTTWLASMLTHICICTPLTRNWQIKPFAGST